MLDYESAEVLVSNIVTNQDSIMYFSNFDHWIDWVTVSFWIIGLSGLVFGLILALRTDSENEFEALVLTQPEKEYITTDAIGDSEE